MIDKQIIIRHVTKKFKRRLKSRGKKENFLALDDISFVAKNGSTIGIVGKNGSGKTTLGKIIAGIYPPTSGEVITNGKLMYLGSMSNGLKSRLSVKNNIFLAGSILGLSQKNIKEIFKPVVEFAGLENFVNAEIAKFSSGMKSRLSFSITVHCLEYYNPQIIIFDEIGGGGGDEEYRAKSSQKIQEIITDKTRTLILITHRMKNIKEYCNKAIWLHDGKIFAKGKPEKVAGEYQKFAVKKSIVR